FEFDTLGVQGKKKDDGEEGEDEARDDTQIKDVTRKVAGGGL
ncbi:hypothetical protein AVEN_123157-1, partial [Araneus ventricosus]